jgi:acyl-CoA thioesterase I
MEMQRGNRGLTPIDADHRGFLMNTWVSGIRHQKAISWRSRCEIGLVRKSALIRVNRRFPNYILAVRWMFIAAVILGLAAGCSRGTGAVRIMPLGDSITQGDRTHNSYRRDLWRLLAEAGYSVDFVGSTSRNHWGGPPNRDFDPHHEGHWGWRADQILARIDAWASAKTPDVALVHLGSNDLAQGQDVGETIEEIRGIIRALRVHRPGVSVLVAKLIPADGLEARVTAFNRELDALSQMDEPSARVILVDQFSGFDVARMTHDGVHPNAEGERHMAERWLEALKLVLGES